MCKVCFTCICFKKNLYKVYKFVALVLTSILYFNFFLSKEKKIISPTPILLIPQPNNSPNGLNIWRPYHINRIKIFNSVLFFFGQIWVKAIWLYQNTTNLLLFFDSKNFKTKITNSLQCFQVVLQYANSVDKKYEKNGACFPRKC